MFPPQNKTTQPPVAFINYIIFPSIAFPCSSYLMKAERPFTSSNKLIWYRQKRQNIHEFFCLVLCTCQISAEQTIWPSKSLMGPFAS